MKNKKIILLFLTICCFLQTQSIYANNPIAPLQMIEQKGQAAPPELEADAAILIDAKTGTILAEKNSSAKEYPASITKLMTVLLALEKGNLNDTLTFSRDAIYGIEPGSSHIALNEGEQITLEQALYAIMLQSANEASLGVAEYISGSKEEFAKLMTSRAKELGCQNTNFVNPNGLHDENHYTTAYDMALIAQELLKNHREPFLKIMGTIRYEIPPTNKQVETRYLYGQHQMIKPPSIYVYEGCLGGKTGFTNEALNTLVTYAKRGDTELIAVALKCKSAGHYKDTISLFDYGFSNFETKQLLAKGSFKKEVSMEQSYKKQMLPIGTIGVIPENDVFYTATKTENISNITQEMKLEETYAVPVAEGEPLGTLSWLSGGKVIAEVPLVATESSTGYSLEDLQKNDLHNKLTWIKYGGIGLLLILILFLAIIFHSRRKRRYRSRRPYRRNTSASLRRRNRHHNYY